MFLVFLLSLRWKIACKRQTKAVSLTGDSGFHSDQVTLILSRVLDANQRLELTNFECFGCSLELWKRGLMGIVIGSCMAKETSAVNINSPVTSLVSRNNNIDYSDRSEPLRMLMVGPGSYPSMDYIQHRTPRALSSPVPYAYIHSASHHTRGHQTRRVVHGQFCSPGPIIFIAPLSSLLALILGHQSFLLSYQPMDLLPMSWIRSKYILQH